MIVLPMVAALAAAAPAPGDFAYSWPLALAGDEGAHRVELTEEVYRRVLRADLADVVAFDAQGRPVPFGPVPLPPGAPRELVRGTVALPWFRVPHEAGAPVEEWIDLHLERGPDGRLAPVVHAGVVAAAPVEDLILDAGGAAGGIDAIELALDAAAAGALSTRVDVLASDDLDAWRVVASAQPLVSLEHQGRRLERRRIELPGIDAEYLLLRRAEGTGPLPVAGVTAHTAEYAPGVPAGARQALEPRAVQTGEPGVFDYDTGGPFPIERAQVVLAQLNSVAQVRVESRAAPDAAWVPRAATTAFRLRASGAEIENLADDVERTRDRYWRIATTPPASEPPKLVLGWRADAFVLLAQGTPPYRIAAGSHVQRREPYPLGVLLDELRARLGDRFTPATATLGTGTPTIGASTEKPKPPLPWLRWSLWIVLVGGAAAIVWMVARLLAERRPEPGPP